MRPESTAAQQPSKPAIDLRTPDNHTLQLLQCTIKLLLLKLMDHACVQYTYGKDNLGAREHSRTSRQCAVSALTPQQIMMPKPQL